MTPNEGVLERPTSKNPQVVEIPLAKIRPNAHQPRQVISQEAIDLMAESLQAIGQQTPAKVVKISSQLAVDSSQPGMETSEAESNHEYILVGGHIRYAGAKKAGLASLNCLVLDLKAEPFDGAQGALNGETQSLLAALMDNQSTDMHWLDWVLAIERLYEAMPTKSQDKLGAQLGLTGPRINQTLKVGKALNLASRTSIVKQFNAVGPDRAVAERTVRALAELMDPQKPFDQAQGDVEAALKVVLEKGMTESQAKALVAHMKAGGQAGEHVPAAKRQKGSSQVTADRSQENTSSQATADSNQPEATKTQQSANTDPSGASGLVWSQLAGLPLIKDVQAKLKKGEALTWGDKLVITLHSLAVAAGWAWKHLLFPALKLIQRGLLWAARNLARLAKDSGHTVLKALGRTVYNLLRVLGSIVLLGILVWVGFDILVRHYGFPAALKDVFYSLKGLL